MATKTDEAKLIKAVEKVITATSAGMSPNAAIEKVAKEDQLGPGQIETVVSAFNKSKSVCILKQADSDKTESFELADPVAIMKSIFGEKDMQKTAHFLPRLNLSKIDFPAPATFQKAASEEPKPTQREAYYKMQKHAQVQRILAEKVRFAVAEAQHNFCTALDNVVEKLKPMSTRDLQKVANIVVNGYQEQEAGHKFMELCCKKMNREDLTLQKTASSAVFPVKEPYIAISKLFKTAKELVKAKNNSVFFSKEAELSIGDFVSSVSANLFTGNDTSGTMEKVLGPHPKGEILDELLDSEHYNKLKALDAKKNLMELALYDKHLHKYDLETLVESFNDVVSLNPKAYNNKALLKNLMLSHIESGGVRGLYELGAEVSLAKAMDEKGKLQADMDSLKRKETRDRKQEVRDEDRLRLEKEKLKEDKRKTGLTAADMKTRSGQGKDQISLTKKIADAKLKLDKAVAEDNYNKGVFDRAMQLTKDDWETYKAQERAFKDLGIETTVRLPNGTTEKTRSENIKRGSIGIPFPDETPNRDTYLA
jgi:hypothetical protein